MKPNLSFEQVLGAFSGKILTLLVYSKYGPPVSKWEWRGQRQALKRAFQSERHLHRAACKVENGLPCSH